MRGALLLVLLVLVLFLASCGGEVLQESWFEDQTVKAGVDAPHVNRSFKNPYAEIMQGYTALGASAAVADYNGDGFPDIFFTVSNEDGLNRLYRNGGDFSFTEVAAELGVDRGNDDANASANSLWFDYDNDGDPDLLLVRFGQNVLYRNDGGKFTDVTADVGLAGRYLNCIVAIAFDHDLDGDLDLFLGNYFQPVNLFDPKTPRFFPESFETATNGGGMTVYRNDGNAFTEVTEDVGIKISGWTLDLGHADADHDGDDDLYVAADFGTDSFFRNNGDGTFTDITPDAIGIDTKKGMNADWADFDGDGFFDVFVTNITDEYMNEGNFLWQNLGDLTFADVAPETGTRDTGWGWAGKFFDYDNDGRQDLYVANGWVSASKDPQDNYVLDIFEVIKDPNIDLADVNNWPPMGHKTLSGYQRNSLFHNEGGLFRDEAARHGVDSELDARGVAVADFDRDGRQDLFVTHAGESPLLLRNRMPEKRHWMRFHLVGDQSNRDAIGARVWIEAGGRAQVGFVNGGNGFASQSQRHVHFGLNQAAAAENVAVVWPSGLRQEFVDVPAGRIYQLREGEKFLYPTSSRDGLAESARRAASPGVPEVMLANFLGGPVDATGAGSESGAESVTGVDLEAALNRFEAALTAEPNDLRQGADYRQRVIVAGEKDPKVYGRAIAFFEKLVKENPQAANARLNLAFIHVDKIPVEGAITQVLLANTALNHFGQALEVEESWLGLYSRGHAYLFWPSIFGRAEDGIRDLRRAIEVSSDDPDNVDQDNVDQDSGDLPFHGRAWAALGDGYWRLGDLAKARTTWKEGLDRYPNDPAIQARLAAKEDAELHRLLSTHYDTNQRVETHLREIFGSPNALGQGSHGPTSSASPGAASPSGSRMRFEEIGEKAGVRFVHSTRKFRGRPKSQVLEMFTDGGAAVAVGDYNADGLDDLFLTDTDEGKRHHLMRNNGVGENGELSFTEVTEEAGVGGGNDARSIVSDALWFDYDNDGHLDLYLGRFGTPLLFRNGGPSQDYRFTDISEQVGLTAFANTIGIIAFDADSDGWLDLMLANYFQPVNLLELETTRAQHNNKVLPNNLDYADNGGGVTFLRNVPRPGQAGGRGFVDETEQAGLAHHTGWSLDIGHADLDGDGDQDVYVASDFGTDRLFWGGDDGTFIDATEEVLGLDTKKGMNVDMGDFDRNGHLDIYVTNITDEYMKECNMLWQNFGDGVFMDLSKETGTCDTDWGWAAKFGDFDNDGWEDLFVVNGLRSSDKSKNYIPVLLDTTILKPGVDFSDLESYPDIGDMTWSGYQRQRLFQNLEGGMFKEIGSQAGVDNDLDGRGIGMGDFDNDGRLDFLQTNANQPSLLYRGVPRDAGHWVELVLVGTRSNKNAIGARVIVEAGGERYLREVNGGNGYSSQSTFRLHFGLGDAPSVDAVEIRWPGPGHPVERITSVPIDAISVIKEGKARIE